MFGRHLQLAILAQALIDYLKEKESFESAAIYLSRYPTIYKRFLIRRFTPEEKIEIIKDLETALQRRGTNENLH